MINKTMKINMTYLKKPIFFVPKTLKEEGQLLNFKKVCL